MALSPGFFQTFAPWQYEQSILCGLTSVIRSNTLAIKMLLLASTTTGAFLTRESTSVPLHDPS